MSFRLSPAVLNWLRDARTSVRRRVHESLLCRECGQQVRLLANVCEHCGAGNPIKIHVSPSLIITAAACEAVLILMSLH